MREQDRRDAETIARLEAEVARLKGDENLVNVRVGSLVNVGVANPLMWWLRLVSTWRF